MNRATATAIFGTELASADRTPPEWIELFPAGPNLTAADGRKWIANPEGVIADFASRGRPIAIDYDHAMALRAPRGDEAIAAGWIVALENRDGAVWGKVEWTERAAAMIVAREYRYVSPEFHRNKDGQILRLEGVGLVNRPALEELTALSSKDQTTKKETDMKEIATALGLAETADEPAVLARLTEQAGNRTALCAALKLDGGADQAAILAAIAKLQETATAAPGAATELAALKTSLETAATRIAELETAGHSRDVNAALDEVQAAGKITPASREKYREMCADAAGLKRFRELAATLPKIAEPTALSSQAKTGEGEMSATELAAKARKYQQEQHAAGNMISTTAAVLHIQETAK